MITFRHEETGGLVVITASTGRLAAGSVTIREHGPHQIAVGRLNVRPEWRGQHIGRSIMLHVLETWENADVWLYAEPYEPFTGGHEGLSREALERFYLTLGFRRARDATGRAAMLKPRDARHMYP